MCWISHVGISIHLESDASSKEQRRLDLVFSFIVLFSNLGCSTYEAEIEAGW